MAGPVAFTGRDEEMDELERSYSVPHSMVLITGRPRTGKSRLIREFVRGRAALHFTADRIRPEVQLASFSERVCRALGTVPARFASWQEAVTAYVGGAAGRRILVFDDVQNIASQDSGFLRTLAAAWDGPLSDADAMLILCGSDSPFMNRMVAGGGPLEGKVRCHLRVGPLGFRDTVPGRDYRQAVEEYAVTGGVPYYMELMDGSVSAVDNVRRLTLAPGAPLFEEPERLMSGRFREAASYNALLASIAGGNTKLDAICSDLRCRTSDITPYLRSLAETGFIERRVPVTELDPGSSRRGRYFIADPFVSLWFRFVSPYRADIEARETDEAEARLRGHFIDAHVSFVFEDISRRELRRHLRSKGVAARYGSYWDAGTEIDVVAVDPDGGTVYAGGCRYRESPVGEDVLHSLVRKSEGVAAFEGMRIVPCVFSASGYTDGALREAERLGAMLFDCGEPVPRSARGHVQPSAELRFP